ncbi:hypothetical protein EHW71_14970 [Clostridium butyricum]|jgi:hypothetical protein|uniref:hypothetical protein n=1 Tax=Clostridium butyricum TaxID=1492 RepID=UPI000F548B4A|nr:hypothetical protein [Clostridium butyricum]RQN07948.1 hypothetical protein EHW71_14970 [Clostridium butyricum]
MNKKTTSKKISSKAGSILSNPNSSYIQRKLAASALSQSSTNKQTGKNMETLASKALNSPKYNDLTKSLAASVLSQSNSKR